VRLKSKGRSAPLGRGTDQKGRSAPGQKKRFSTVLLRTIFVKSTPKTIDKKATNGDRNGTLKMIQRAVTIAEFRLDHARRMQIIHKIATMEEGVIELTIKEPLFVHRLSVFF
jgi:hypothetical protein